MMDDVSEHAEAVDAVIHRVVEKARKQESRYVFSVQKGYEDLLTEEGLALVARHSDELAPYKDIPLDMDKDLYRAMGDAGAILAAVIRDRETGTLVGYCVFLVANSMHYMGSFQAMQDVFFIAPEHRGTNLGKRLIEFSEDMLRDYGVQVVIQESTVEHPLFGKLLSHSGYEQHSTTWIKRLY